MQAISKVDTESSLGLFGFNYPLRKHRLYFPFAEQSLTMCNHSVKHAQQNTRQTTLLTKPIFARSTNAIVSTKILGGGLLGVSKNLRSRNVLNRF